VKALPPPARLLDYGCGIGSDGLVLIEAGYEVAFADYNNPSTRYLRWRLAHRGLEAQIYDLDQGEPQLGFDLAYAFDVIEHVDDPFAFLEKMEAAARLILVNLLEPGENEPQMHRVLPIPALLDHAHSQKLLFHQVHHGRSHLVLYERA
jgi:cyclopropane fatty-acyl-phospholipid synthase-like methyltransferase